MAAVSGLLLTTAIGVYRLVGPGSAPVDPQVTAPSQELPAPTPPPLPAPTRPPEVQPGPTAPTGETITTPSPEPPPATVTTTLVTVDIRPWARVRIMDADGTAQGATYTTPFAIALAPGRYTLQCENGGLTRPLTLPVTVTAGSPVVVSRAMPGFDAARIVDTLLGSQE
jgi:hypothetical protein